MDSGVYNFDKLTKLIKKATFGMKFPIERYELLNKFGYFYDSLNSVCPGWTQKVSQEAESQLINLFEYINQSLNQTVFISTSRVGFTINEIELKKENIDNLLNNKLNEFSNAYTSLINTLGYLEFSRFGLYFEFLLTEDDIHNFSKLKIFDINLHSKKIFELEEINQRFSYTIEPKTSSVYYKMILQFQKVMHKNKNNSMEVGYLLTTDFQSFFEKNRVGTKEEFISFISTKLNENYKMFKEHFCCLTAVKENS